MTLSEIRKGLAKAVVDALPPAPNPDQVTVVCFRGPGDLVDPDLIRYMLRVTVGEEGDDDAGDRLDTLLEPAGEVSVARILQEADVDGVDQLVVRRHDGWQSYAVAPDAPRRLGSTWTIDVAPQGG